ncbi:putative protein kinase RLK-Pelle-WAK-LRK10L-1 family [Helianthus annuus]|nr:putative protein kinase RLK-Pelle-WAK-LRK10L-1 family [Helianthus annuus]KAJ0954420.1 putative protein kinase RLK-Pelle-WAK-LRK10L-1 family [Helianthus annuus]
MKPLLDPSPALIAMTVVLATVMHFPALRGQETQPYDACDQSAECGDKDFEYPFWGLGRPAHCGHPSFQLTCEYNVPLLLLDSVSYRVIDKESTTHTITIARNDLWSTICPQHLRNTTYDTNLFNGDNFGQEDVSMYYGCQDTNNITPGIWSLAPDYRFDCNVNEPQSNNYFITTSSVVADIANFLAQCNSSITVPVGRRWADRLATVAATDEDLRQALKDGFTLEWIVNNDVCDRCDRSGGHCGSSSTSPDEFVCYCASGNFSATCNNVSVKSKGGGSKSSSVGIVLGIVGGVIAIAIAGFVIFVFRRRKRRAIKVASPAQTETKAIMTVAGSSQGLTSDTSNFTSSNPSFPSSKTSKTSKASETSETSKEFTKSTYFGAQVFTYEELEVATDNFNDSRQLGDGGFGAVYFGKLLDGREVAVKRLYENNFKRVEQFINEVRILTGLYHENLVKLYGCTSKRSKALLLVYEYIPNGTIADHLHGKLANTSSSLFSWSIRLNIAIQTADALAYLHKSGIIHRDVKTNNILLDKSFQVKVADFGLSRLFENVTHVSTAPQGTPGYVDPEYYQCYQLTDKSDVYSFGVVLVELISSLPAVDTSRHRLDINLANMAVTKIQNHTLSELVDKSIGFETNDLVRRMTTLVAELAFRCLQHDKDMRPTMKEVVETLKGIQNDDLNAQKPEVLDIMVDDGGMLKGNNTEPTSPDSGVSNIVVGSSAPNSSDG